MVEASYMIGLERNADKVALACYAPMLANIDHVNWRPDLVWFDQEKVYGSQNYYIQKFFMANQGVRNIGWTASDLPETEVYGEPTIHGGIGFAGDLADIRYENMTIVDHVTGEVTSIPDGTISANAVTILANIESTHYTITFDFKKTGGKWDKGFSLLFSHQDDKNTMSWLLGGWQNQDSIIRSVCDNRISDLTQTIWSVEQDKLYQCKLTVKDRNISAWIDGELFNEIEAKLPQKEGLYINAVEDASGAKIVKLVNVRDEAITVNVACEAVQAAVYTIYGEKGAFNTLDNPRDFNESTYEIQVESNRLDIEVPALGVAFVTLK
ncbi:hypothetical protein J14TS2_11550 [Bacillus sp. J14TS2]|nr:hypothetical protein J14TS2_11550 [Bacillus sp. J14TS2]